MKWIGQHIYDLVSRFRDDVYLEGISTSTETDMLVVDSDNKVSKRAIDAITVDVSDFMTNGTNNFVLTATGTDGMNAEGNLTFDGTELLCTGNTIIQPGEEATATAFTITNGVGSQIALDIAASNTTADVINITADSVTTGNVIDISCDALGTGSALKIEDNSATTGVGGGRNIVDIYQKNTAATVAQALQVKSDGGQTAVLIDKNASGTAAQNAQALKIDFDRTVPGSGTAAHNDIGIDIDVNSASLGTSVAYGMDIDVVGATSGTSTAYGIDIDVNGADTNHGIRTTLQDSSGYGCVLKSTVASSSTSGGSLALISNDGAAMGDDHRLGVISFGGQEGTTIIYGARIQAMADAAWSTSENGTRLEFYTMDGDNASELSLTLDSDKLATFAGAVTVTGTITGDVTGDVTGDLTGQAGTVATIAGLAPNTATTQATQPNIESIGTDGDTLAILADQLTMSNATASMPTVKLTNTTDDDASSELIFEKLRDDDAVATGQNLGAIWFRGQDSGQSTEDYAYIIGEIDVSANTQESGKLTLGVANHDGGNGAGLILTGGSADNEIDVTVGLGAASVTTVAGDLTVTGSDLTFDSVALTAVQTSGESFVDNDTSIMTSAAIDDKINTKYARSTITFAAQATMLSSGNWVTTGQGGVSNHTWNQDMGVNTETNGTSTGSLAKQYGHMGIRMPYACTIESLSAGIRNASGDRQITIGLFCGRAADSGSLPDWGTTNATEPILQIHADANNESGSYQNRPSHAEVSTDVAMAAGDMFYPAMKLTGITSSGDTDTALASFTIGIKTLIA